MGSGAEVVQYARQQIGDPYVWAAEGPNAFDCSGLAWSAAKAAGQTIPRTTSAMMSSKSNLLQLRREADLRPGDLVFFNWTGTPHSHVAIWTGQGTIIEAPRRGAVVQEVKYTDSYRRHADAFRRIPGLDGAPSPATVGAAAGAVTGALSGAGMSGGGSAATGALLPPDVLSWIPNPANLTEATSNVASAIKGGVDTLTSVGAVAGAIEHALMPSNLIRGFCLFMGTIFILIGIWFLGREIKES